MPFRGTTLVAKSPQAQAQSAMANSAAGFYDREFNNYDSIMYGLSRDIAGIYEKPLHLMLDATFYYPRPVSGSDSPPQENSGYGSTFWPNRVQEHDHSNSRALEGGSNWLGEYGSCICGGWGEDFQFWGWGTVDHGYGGGSENTEDSYHGGEKYDSYYKEKEKQPAYNDYSHSPSWSGYGSWFGCGVEEDFYESSRLQEPKLTHDFPDEFGIYQGIFGYWPCMFQKNCSEQDAYDYENPWKGTADSFRW